MSSGSSELLQGAGGRAIYDLATTAADYEPWSRAPLRTVILCSHMRSGSTLLGEALYFAGVVGCPIEYFHRGFRPTLERCWEAAGPKYLAELCRRRTDSTGTLGVKLFWVDIVDLCSERFPEHSELLAPNLDEDASAEQEVYTLAAKRMAELFPEPAFILLDRRDRLRPAVSASLSVQTQVWRRIPGVQDNTPVCEPQFMYEESLYASATYAAERWNRMFAHMGVTPHRVDYEALASSYGQTVCALIEAMGSPATGDVPRPRMARQADAFSEQFMKLFLDEHEERRRGTGAAGNG